MTPAIETALLKERPDAVSQLAHWYYEEWGRHDGKTLESVTARLAERVGNMDDLPLHVVAIGGDDVVGAAALVQSDMDILTELTPWVSSVYVADSHRRKGIGRTLLHRLEREARRLGFNRLYLYTRSEGNVAFYGGLGWQTIQEVDYHGKAFVVMVRGLTDTDGGAM